MNNWMSLHRHLISNWVYRNDQNYIETQRIQKIYGNVICWLIETNWDTEINENPVTMLLFIIAIANCESMHHRHWLTVRYEGILFYFIFWFLIRQNNNKWSHLNASIRVFPSKLQTHPQTTIVLFVEFQQKNNNK